MREVGPEVAEDDEDEVALRDVRITALKVGPPLSDKVKHVSEGYLEWKKSYIFGDVCISQTLNFFNIFKKKGKKERNDISLYLGNLYVTKCMWWA